MNSFRIEKKDIYTIEVNDNKDFIEFDLADIGLPFKCAKALEEIDKIDCAWMHIYVRSYVYMYMYMYIYVDISIYMYIYVFMYRSTHNLHA